MSSDALASATALHAAGRAAESAAAYATALRASPTSAVAHNNAASLLASHGTPAAARAAARLLRRALVLAPNYVEAYTNLATAVSQLKITSLGNAAVAANEVTTDAAARRSAIRLLAAAIPLSPNSSQLYSRLGAALCGGAPMPSLPQSTRAAAAALARIAVTLSPSSPDLWSNLGLARASLHDRDGAKRAYRAATSLQPTSVEALIGLAAAFDHPTEAEAVLRDAIAAAPHHPGARYNLGNLLHTSALGEFGEFSPRSAEAVQCFREAARLAPRHVYAHYNAALAAQQAHASRPRISCTSRRCISARICRRISTCMRRWIHLGCISGISRLESAGAY